MGDAQRHYAKCKKSDTQGYILYDSIYMTFWKRQNTGTEIQSAVAGN